MDYQWSFPTALVEYNIHFIYLWYRRRPHADGSDIYPTYGNRWVALGKCVEKSSGHAVLMRAGVAYNCPVIDCRHGARATGGREGKAIGAQRMYAPTLPFSHRFHRRFLKKEEFSNFAMRRLKFKAIPHRKVGAILPEVI